MSAWSGVVTPIYGTEPEKPKSYVGGASKAAGPGFHLGAGQAAASAEKSQANAANEVYDRWDKNRVRGRISTMLAGDGLGLTTAPSVSRRVLLGA